MQTNRCLSIATVICIGIPDWNLNVCVSELNINQSAFYGLLADPIHFF